MAKVVDNDESKDKAKVQNDHNLKHDLAKFLLLCQCDLILILVDGLSWIRETSSISLT